MKKIGRFLMLGGIIFAMLFANKGLVFILIGILCLSIGTALQFKR